MLAKSLTVPLFIATSVLAIPTVVRRGDVPLSNWQSQNLESYWTFKMRFNSLNCASQTGTDFYTTCCYPLAAGQSLSDRPAECTPTTCAAPPTQDPTPTYPAPMDPAPAPAATESSTNDDDQDCDDGDDDEWDDGDENTSTAPTPTDNGDPSSSSQDDSQPSPTQDSQDTGSPDTSNANTNNNVNTGGFATYFYQNGNAGACGQYHSDNDLIAAIDIDRYGDDSQVSPLCGQRVHITNTNNGKSVDVIIADVCPTCANSNSIDLSYGAFSQLADSSEGMVPIAWYFE